MLNFYDREAESLLEEIQAATHRGKSQIVLDLLRHEMSRIRRGQQLRPRRGRRPRGI